MTGTSSKPSCRSCDATALPKDVVALNRKLFPAAAKRREFLCLACMAEYLECSEEDLRDKIEEFKAEGCKLFS